ncbi:hypothetical protein PanWU01x14_253060 [Parasponia andersonii]|uniref:Uncharacterized protein n=1 Tax=Parasponia andersonii TaxID=3476 RepID=A0A2P5BBL8_PARAD|nr:hypothetical protein PanWU01x14_253060 [Parasponia andersonii]
MENRVETQTTPIESPVLSEETVLEQITPTPVRQMDQTSQKSPSSGIDLRKPTTPHRLKVPKAFKYPERYRSPTDSMMSPVTKGLLARSRKGGALLPPSRNQLKIQDFRLQDVGLIKN